MIIRSTSCFLNPWCSNEETTLEVMQLNEKEYLLYALVPLSPQALYIVSGQREGPPASQSTHVESVKST